MPSGRTEIRVVHEGPRRQNPQLIVGRVAHRGRKYVASRQRGSDQRLVETHGARGNVGYAGLALQAEQALQEQVAEIEVGQDGTSTSMRERDRQVRDRRGL